VIESVGALEIAKGRKIELHSPGNVWLNANFDEMKQLLLNLLLNALEATAAGTGVVKIELHAGEPVELSVNDNGIGMNHETLGRIFEPFYSEKRPTGRSGTGLGLAIVQAIVDAHGGTIHASSDGPASGTRMVVRLPTAAQP
jgi:signal transduction histidine kinase